MSVAVDALFGNPVYRAIAARQFNSITAENQFKADRLHPEENTFDWALADSLTSFCKDQGKRLHGHTLIWHQQLPQWLVHFKGSAADWDTLMKKHIHTIVTHFKGRVRAWDVVNEAFNEDGTLRNSIWRQKIGDTYIAKAFTYAHEADPDALLFYNDYNLESNPAKRSSVIHCLNSLRLSGVRADGIGLQMHISTESPEPAQIAKALQEVAANDYKVHISELDISVNPRGKDIDPGPALFERQAALLALLVRHYNQLQPRYRYGITFWGVSDRDSWIRTYYGREDYPLLYDDNYLLKSAYCTLKENL